MDEFKKGQEVIALLDKEHSTEGESADHKAKFLGYHLDRQWADVELEAEHAGGTKRLSVPVSALKALLVLFAVLCAAFPSRAQFIGYVSPQTEQQALASNVACTGTTQNFNVANFGQTQHRVMIAWNGQPQSSLVVLQGIDVAGNATVLSDGVSGQTPGVSASIISGEGYYPIVRVSVVCSSAGAPTFTLTYMGGSSSAAATNGSALFNQQNKILFAGIAANASAASNVSITPFGNSAGVILFQYSGGAGPAGSTIVAKCGSALSLVNVAPFITYTFVPSTATALQQFTIPSGPCMQYFVNYNSGGASAATLNLEYVFTPSSLYPSSNINSLLNNGNNDGAILTEKGARWTLVSTPAAGTQATTTRAAGNTNTRKVADCVNYSAGAIAAPAATALQINLRDGTSGAGTILWSITVVAPATAGQHVNGHVCGLNLIGSNQTAMTLEFSAALASESESVTLTGYDVQ